ncbi:hypothetical protein K438DRAFT_1779720 [Mycena galopus ATCC 62051]|nr:hypothetical protein K438DRAFT_1779720 [Mycena galopus ATCC 62051]
MPPRRTSAWDDILIDPALLAESATAHQPPTPAVPKNSAWTAADETKLLDFLAQEAAAAGDGANFKAPTYTSAAALLNQSITKGGPKTADSCKSKYQKLKGIYQVVCDIIGNSGWAWDDVRGACIGPANEGTWDAWVEKNPKAAPFRNAGWMHLDTFRTLIPDAVPRGTHVFRPHIAPSQPVSQPSQDDDEEPYPDWPPSDGENDVPHESAHEKPESDSEDEKENQLAPKTPAVSRKRPAETPGTSVAKKARVSGGAAALQDIAGQALDFNTIFRDAFAPQASKNNVPPTPVHLKKAIDQVKKLERWLDNLRLITLIDVLENSKNAIDAYNSLLDDEELRVLWVKRKVGIPI